MEVTVKLFATLRQGRFKVKPCAYKEGTTVGDVIKQLAIPQEELGIVFLNGKHTELDTLLKNADVLSIFPPVGGG